MSWKFDDAHSRETAASVVAVLAGGYPGCAPRLGCGRFRQNAAAPDAPVLFSTNAPTCTGQINAVFPVTAQGGSAIPPAQASPAAGPTNINQRL